MLILQKHDTDYKHRLETLEMIVIQKNEKDDAFEKINAKIGENESFHKQVEF